MEKSKILKETFGFSETEPFIIRIIECLTAEEKNLYVDSGSYNFHDNIEKKEFEKELRNLRNKGGINVKIKRDNYPKEKSFLISDLTS